jgi:hypothetical protein
MFEPSYGTGQLITATTTSSNTAITGDGDVVRVVHTVAGGALVYMRLSDSASAVATVADFVLLPNVPVCIPRSTNFSRIALIAASGSHGIHVITGQEKDIQ